MLYGTPMAVNPIEEQQQRPTDGSSLPLEYSAGEIAVRVQAAPRENGTTRRSRSGVTASTPLGVSYGFRCPLAVRENSDTSSKL